ncbi:hypothetical protein MRX96_056211 [Rhipicephalus microplus]
MGHPQSHRESQGPLSIEADSFAGECGRRGLRSGSKSGATIHTASVLFISDRGPRGLSLRYRPPKGFKLRRRTVAAAVSGAGGRSFSSLWKDGLGAPINRRRSIIAVSDKSLRRAAGTPSSSVPFPSSFLTDG